MKKLSASASRLATIGIAVAAAVALNPGLVEAAADYPAVTYQRLTDAHGDPG